MNFYDGFFGVGGFHLGITQAHPDWKCVGGCEINTHCQSVYKKHFNEVNIDADIRKVEELPKHTDLFCGGFPCQDLSLAGKRKGLGGERSGLFYEIVRLAAASKPKCLFLENVKGLLSSERGWDFAKVLLALEEIGYSPQWAVLNTADILPQNRERAFIVATLGAERPPQIFPIGEDGGEIDNEPESGELRKQTAVALQARQYASWSGNFVEIPAIIGHTRDKTGKEISYHKKDIVGTLKGATGNQAEYVGLPKVAPCLTGGGHSGGLHSDMLAICLQDGNKAGYSIAKEGDGINLSFSCKKGRGRVLKGRRSALQTQGAIGTVVPVLTPDRHEKRQNGRRFKTDGEPMFTLNTQDRHGVALHDGTQMRIRRLTPIECEKLQGFPINWTKYYANGNEVSDSQRYRMLGNAVTVPVIKKIAERLI